MKDQQKESKVREKQEKRKRQCEAENRRPEKEGKYMPIKFEKYERREVASYIYFV